MPVCCWMKEADETAEEKDRTPIVAGSAPNKPNLSGAYEAVDPQPFERAAESADAACRRSATHVPDNSPCPSEGTRSERSASGVPAKAKPATSHPINAIANLNVSMMPANSTKHAYAEPTQSPYQPYGFSFSLYCKPVSLTLGRVQTIFYILRQVVFTRRSRLCSKRHGPCYMRGFDARSGNAHVLE